jgi:hypothetical protein
MDDLSKRLRESVSAREQTQEARLAPYVSAIEAAAAKLGEGASMTDATLAVLGLDETARCFVLDASGRQIGDNLLPEGRSTQRAKRFRPLLHSEGASWARRPYFIGAIGTPGRVHLTPPYLSINEAHLCVTASIAAQTPHGLQVLCVDINWEVNGHRR